MFIKWLDRIKRHIIQKFLNYLVTMFNIKIFFLRKFFLGSENANNYLKSLNQNAIVPILRLNGAKVGKKTKVLSGVVFHNSKDFSNLEIGENCHIGKECFFDLREKVTIKSNVVIAMRCNFITHIDMSNSQLSKLYEAKALPIIIENDVYLASNVNVLMGVTINSFSFVAANSLVNKNVSSNTLVGGTPIRKIKELDGV